MIDFKDTEYDFKFECRQNCSAYNQGRADERASILGMVDFKQSKDYRTRSVNIKIRFEEMLEPEQVVNIILEQLKEQSNSVK